MKEGARRANGICEGKLARTVFTGHERKLPIPASIPQLGGRVGWDSTGNSMDHAAIGRWTKHTLSRCRLQLRSSSTFHRNTATLPRSIESSIVPGTIGQPAYWVRILLDSKGSRSMPLLIAPTVASHPSPVAPVY